MKVRQVASASPQDSSIVGSTYAILKPRPPTTYPMGVEQGILSDGLRVLVAPFQAVMGLLFIVAMGRIWNSYRTHTRFVALAATTGAKTFAEKKEDLKEVLKREYTTLFDPFERQYYTPEVSFTDPMTSFTGMDKYQGNVDMLAGRTGLGKLLFSDAAIIMFNVEDMGERGLRTRWMLRLCAKILPWKPMARFTGVSEYKLDEDCKVVSQQDYWDSINLLDGEYKPVSTLEGVLDFLGQLKKEPKASTAMGSELPYILLRRAKYYSVRKYPKTRVARTTYLARPDAYDRLGRYAREAGVSPMVPAILRIPKDESSNENKTMSWPVTFLCPGEANPAEIPEPDFESTYVTTEVDDGVVVAVIEFPEEATPRNVDANAKFLEAAVARDGLVVKEQSKGQYTIAQYNALFSLQKRRNEVWVELEKHDWE